MQPRLSGSVALLVLFAALSAVVPTATLVTDWMWFRSMALESVFLQTFAVQAALGLGVGAIGGAIVYGSAAWAFRHTRRAELSEDLLDNPVGQLLQRTPPSRIAIGLGAVTALLLGLQAASWWKDLLLMLNGGSFGFEDPVMGFDAGFYVFTLPMLLHLRSALTQAVVVAGLAAAGLYVLRGGIRVQLTELEGQLVARGLDMPMAARRHLGALAASLLILTAIGTYLRRYTLLYDQSGLFAGPGYADVHGTLPLLTLQAIAAAVAAFLVYVGFERLRGVWLAVGGSAVLVFSSVAALYPDVVQRFSVLPNELTREAPHIRHHIAATRTAFGLDGVEERPLSGDAELELADIEANAATIRNVRLWDHGPLLETFSQVQEIRTYYNFESVDNDRYVIDGELRQIMLSPRELLASSLPKQAQTWVNQTMTYTHGYGLALGPVNEVTPEGLPELFVQDLPPKVMYPDDLRIDRPEIYFGEAMKTPVLVNTDNPEFDFPAGDENKYTTYDGAGGVPLGALGRYLFALRFGSTEMLFSGDLTPESRVLLHRDLTDRVSRVAPFLRLDRDPYLVIADGRLVWVVDAYTHTDRFPYSRHIQHLGNYLRSTVKITVDAYDGTVAFYLVDPDEPIAAAWAKAFPELFQPMAELPDALRPHLRYPQDLFTVQAELFATYHMQDHQIFYNREDEWEVPTVGGVRMQPYYTIMKLPGEAREEFILMLPFTPSKKDNLAAWMVARSDGEHYGRLRVYKFPKEKMVYGPRMIVARINQDDAISEKMSLWNQQGSTVETGTLLVIPVEESLLYVQPLYLRADNGSIPELKRVIVAYENQIAMQPTLELGLRQIFGGEVPEAVDERVADAAGGEPSPFEGVVGSMAELAHRAGAEWDAVQDAAARGDWAGYGAAMDRLGEVVARLRALEAVAEEVPGAGGAEGAGEAGAAEGSGADEARGAGADEGEIVGEAQGARER